MRIIEVTGRDGRKRKVDLDDPFHADEVARDGDRFQLPMMLCDTAGGLFFRDDAGDSDPYAISDADRQRCVDARQEMIVRVSNAWRDAGHGPPEPAANATRNVASYDGDPFAATDGRYAISDADRQRVIDARQEFIDRTCNAWQGNQPRVLPLADSPDQDARQAAYDAHVHHLQNAWRGAR
jgi:hypothetical protein